MNKRLFLILGTLALAATACKGGESSIFQSLKDGAGIGGEQKAVYANQERNGLCWKTDNCQAGLVCKNANDSTPGHCSVECKTDADCGNGSLCREEACQKDCADINEKCSSKRECCFFDSDEDRKNNAFCSEGEDQRCITDRVLE